METGATRSADRDPVSGPAHPGATTARRRDLPPPEGAGTRSSRRGGRRATSTASLVLLPLLGLALVVTAWWAATAVLDVAEILLPPPADVVSELTERFAYLTTVQGKVTLVETVVGYGLTVVGGLAIGVAIATSRIIDQMVSPWLVALNAVPKIALAPLLIVWLGLNMQPRIAMVVLLCFFPIVLATATGLKSTPAEYVELARSLDASRWQAFVKLRFPHALPQIFVGLKVAMPLAVIGAVIGEFAGGRSGLGFTINQASGSGDTAQAFAAIAILSAMSIVLFYALVLAERLLLPWVRATTA